MIRQDGFTFGIDLERDETFVHQGNDARVAEGGFIELPAPMTIRRPEVDDDGEVLLVRLLAGGVVIASPAELAPRGEEDRALILRRHGKSPEGDDQEAPGERSAVHEAPSLFPRARRPCRDGPGGRSVGARMRFSVILVQLSRGHMRVNLCRGQAPMPQKLLHAADVRPAIQ